MAVEHVFRSKDTDVDLPDGILLHEFVLEKAVSNQDSVAFLDGISGQKITFSQVRSLMLNVAAGLRMLGIKHGDVVMLLLPNMPEYAPLFLGVNRAGAIATTANPAYTAEELSKQAKDSGTKLVITTSELLSKTKLMTSHPKLVSFGSNLPIGTIPASVLLTSDGRKAPSTRGMQQSDICALPYSSGTTGVAKGVMLSHTNFIANIQQLQGGSSPRLSSDKSDTFLGVLPMFHIYGLNLLCLATLRQGARVITLPRFDMELVLNLIQSLRITVLPIVPPIILGLTKLPLVDKFDLSSMRRIVSGAAPLDANLEAALKKKFPFARVGQGYGMTESSPVVALSPCLAKHAPADVMAYGSAGTLVPLTEAKIVDISTGQSLGPGETGELLCRGPQVMQGYLNNEGATRETITADGWLRTGDIGLFDREGNLFLIDRAKELIKFKGFQVPPAELEGVLLSHPCISDAAVVPAKDDEAGEVPVAFVVLRHVAGQFTSAPEILEFVAKQVAPYKRLKAVHFVDVIPKSVSGKILRRELKARL